jgi:hypothetical protein
VSGAGDLVELAASVTLLDAATFDRYLRESWEHSRSI